MTVERPNTLAGLVEKRAEIAGRIEQLQIEMRELIVAFFVTFRSRRSCLFDLCHGIHSDAK